LIVKELKQTFKTLVPKNKKVDELDLKTVANNLQMFFNFETIGIHPCGSEGDKQLTEKELTCVNLIEQGSYYDKKQLRWLTVLPWDPEKKRNLGPNYNKALAMLYSVEKSVAKKNTLHEVNKAYDQFLIDQFAEKIPENEIYRQNSKIACTFLPSFPVYSMDRVSSRVRPVLHASDKTETGESLNSCLLP